MQQNRSLSFSFGNVDFYIKKLHSTEAFIKKETLLQVFPCKFCEISKNTFYYRRSLVAAPEPNIVI